MDDVTNDTTTVAKKGLTRRQVAIGAAWTVPVIAVATATPAHAASVQQNPTATVGGTMTASSAGSARTVNYTNGFITYDNAGQTGVSSGNLYLDFTWTTAALVPTYDLAAFQAQGWVLDSPYVSGGTSFSFSHAPIANGATVTVPNVTWSGTVSGRAPGVTARLSSDNDDVFGSVVGV
jgi:hypothetical protein